MIRYLPCVSTYVCFVAEMVGPRVNSFLDLPSFFFDDGPLFKSDSEMQVSEDFNFGRESLHDIEVTFGIFAKTRSPSVFLSD